MYALLVASEEDLYIFGMSFSALAEKFSLQSNKKLALKYM